MACYNGDVISLLRNTVSLGTINSNSFAPKVDLTAGDGAEGIFSGDIDGDGKPDLAVANENSNSVSVIRQKDNTPATLHFDGVNDFVSAPLPMNVTDNFTMKPGSIHLHFPGFGFLLAMEGLL